MIEFAIKKRVVLFLWFVVDQVVDFSLIRYLSTIVFWRVVQPDKAAFLSLITSAICSVMFSALLNILLTDILWEQDSSHLTQQERNNRHVTFH